MSEFFESVGITVIVTGCAIILSLAIIMCSIEVHVLKREAIEQGYAQYNPTNSIWEWK